MPFVSAQREWLRGVITGLTALSDNRWMMPTDHLATILTELGSVIEREVGGAVVEMGCAGARTSLRIAAFLRLLGEGEGRSLHLYDSFVGFPDLTPEDYPGDTRKENLRYSEGGPCRLFEEWGDSLAPPVIHKGFFSELEHGEHPSPISFAFIDADAHDSIRTALRIVWPRLALGGTIIVHDYGNPSWPGAKIACDTFFADSIVSQQVERRVVQQETLLTITKLRDVITSRPEEEKPAVRSGKESPYQVYYPH